MLKFLKAGFVLIVFFIYAYSDSLYVYGVVADSDENLVSGARVTIYMGRYREGRQRLIDSVSTLTDGSGAYEVDAEYNELIGSEITIVVSADDYQNSMFFSTIEGPNDGEPDTVNQDITLDAGGEPTAGDSLYVSGSVTDGSDNPIQNATVTVTLGFTGSQVSETTDDNGDYMIATVNSSGIRDIVITATAEGYDQSFVNARVTNPSDGTPDVITEDFTLAGILYDTVNVTGVVLDDADDTPISGALVIVTYGGSGFGGNTLSDTGVTDESGEVDLEMLVTADLGRINWTVEAAGYQSKTGTVSVLTQNSASLDTVRLTAYTSEDSVTYTISGIITDESGNGISGAEVTVTMEYDGEIVFEDVVTSSGSGIGFMRGLYSTETRQPYLDGEITVTASVSAADYETSTGSVTVSTSTSQIVIDITLMAEGTAILPEISVNNGTTEIMGKVSIYTMNGRLIRTVEGNGFNEAVLRGVSRSMSFQPMIIKWSEEGRTVCKKILVR